MKDKYLDFLYKKGFIDDAHRELARYLHTIPFKWTLERDENRMYDGLAMRREYREYSTGSRFDFGSDTTEDFSIYSKLKDNACTMLEFFIGFAWRLERDMIGDSDKGERTTIWVESMLKNLDIWKYDGHIKESEYDEIDKKLNVWVKRCYKENGEGGLFFVPNAKQNMRFVEMWIQASWWYEFWYD